MPREQKPTLMGIDEIRSVVGGASHVTILKWKRQYPSFPIRRLGGIWVGNRDQITDWFARFSKGEVDEDNDANTIENPMVPISESVLGYSKKEGARS